MLCSYCGQAPARLINENLTGACPNCAQYFNTCTLCLHSANCEFQTNPSPLPHQVQHTIRKGNMTAQTIIQNPERVKAFCVPCHCWDAESGSCNRQSGTCGNYNEFIPSPIPHESPSSTPSFQ